MRLAEILTEFGRRYGIERLALDEGGRLALTLDGGRRLVVHRPPGDGAAVFLRMPMAMPALPEAGQAALYRRLLEANLLGQGTAGAVASVDLGAEDLELHRRVPLTERLGPAEFAAEVELLYGAAERLVRELGLEFAAAAAEEQEPPPG